MAGRAALVAALMSVVCLGVAQAQQYVNCADHAHCSTCVVFSSATGNCEWCPQDTECHEPGSIYNPCAAGTSIRNVSQCTPLPPCPTGVDPSIYDSSAALDMIAFADAAYYTDPSQYPNFPAGTTVNVTFTGTVPIEPHTVVNGYTAIYQNRIVVVFEGTATTEQLIEEILNANGVQFKGFGPDVLVLDYFLDSYEVLEQQATQALQALLQDYPYYDVYVTGHSLGGALASLFSLGILADNIVSTAPYLYTMGQPRVGNPAYADLHLQNIPNSFRLVNNRDPVPHIPLEGPDSSSASTDANVNPAREKTVQQVKQSIANMVADKAATAQQQGQGYPRVSKSGRKVEGLLYAFHHGWEIWYPGGEYQNSVMCGNRFCCDAPTGEAKDCSDSLTFDCGSLYNLCIGDHHGYFLVVPNGFCNPSSNNAAISRRR